MEYVITTYNQYTDKSTHIINFIVYIIDECELNGYNIPNELKQYNITKKIIYDIHLNPISINLAFNDSNLNDKEIYYDFNNVTEYTYVNNCVKKKEYKLISDNIDVIDIFVNKYDDIYKYFIIKN